MPKLGVMLVGWGGNNGSTFTAGLIANRLGLSWPTKRGVQKANWFGTYRKYPMVIDKYSNDLISTLF